MALKIGISASAAAVAFASFLGIKEALSKDDSTPGPQAVPSASAPQVSGEATPSAEASVDVDPNDPVALTAANAEQYSEYLATLSPELRADIVRFDDPEVFNGMSYEELRAYFALPATLVTTDGTMESFRPEEYAAAATARLKGISTVANSEAPNDAGFTAETARDLVSGYYPGAIDGFIATVEQTTADQTPPGAGRRALAASNVLVLQQTFQIDVPSYQVHYSVKPGSVNYFPELKRVVWDNAIQDNFPTVEFEKITGINNPADNKTESISLEQITVGTDGNVYATSTN